MAAKQSMPAKQPPKKKRRLHAQPKDMTLEQWQSEVRRATADDKAEDFRTAYSGGEHAVYGDYTVDSLGSGQTYKVALRSSPGATFCSCLDFKTNLLGTCKHIEAVWLQVAGDKKLQRLAREAHEPAYTSLYIRYGAERQVCLRVGSTKAAEFRELVLQFFDEDMVLFPNAYDSIERFLEQAAQIDGGFRCYPDVLDFILAQRDTAARARKLEAHGPELLTGLVQAELYLYQQEGVRFLYRAGRGLLADEMGLGKTIQAIAAAELFARESGVSSVLIVCPTSLKYQWQSEIERFTGKQALVVEGGYAKRRQLYREDASRYKIVSYHAAAHDAELLRQMAPDLIILDEAQRIKNWETKTAQAVKKIPSKYAIVLTGTPLENKLEELYSIIQFIDPFKLGALYRFLDIHQVKDEGGKVVGYEKLNHISALLEDCVLRRTKRQVMSQLPERTDQHIFVEMTPMQYDQHEGYAQDVMQLVAKWRRMGFLDERDRQKLMISLNCMRMLADSTYILDQETRHDTKIDELNAIIETALSTEGVKMVIFSQWERMTRLVRAELELRRIGHAYLHGGIPSAERKGLLDEFRENDACRVFLSTDAGGVGLNLQSASVVVNVDIPWNPAVLEQRIGRVYRHGQKRSVSVINLVSKGSIEERMLDVLAFKSTLFSGVLDGGASEVFMGESKFKKFMGSVEDMTAQPAPPPSADAVIEPEITPEATTSTDQPSETVGVKEPYGAEELDRGQAASEQTAATDMIAAAADLFTNLGRVLAQPQAVEKVAASLVETDTATGQTYLKIPVQSQTAVTSALSALNQFITKLS